MLDILTLRYADLGEGLHLTIGFGMIILGGLIYLMSGRRATVPLGRSRYFMFSGFAFALLAIGQLWWFLYIPALKLGLSWLLMVADLAAAVCFGAYSAHIAVARSLHAYGHGGRAWLSFVPIGNLILLFAPGQPSTDRHSDNGTGGFVLAGLALFAIGRGVSSLLDASLEDYTARLAADPETVALMQNLTMKAQGIETALDALIAAEAAPQQLDPDLLLASVTRVGTALRYEFVLDSPDATSLDAEYRARVKDAMCDGLLRYLEVGATAAIRYTRTDGAEIETLALSLNECTA